MGGFLKKLFINDQLNFIKQCREEGLSLKECPNFLFFFIGLIAIISIVVTYLLANAYFPPEAMIIIIGIMAFFTVIISYFVNQGVVKISQAKKKLSCTNQELTQVLEEIKKEQQMREDFTAMLVHDLRSPLEAIRLIIEMIQERKDNISQKELGESCQAINHSTVNMANLINNLLDVAKFERGKFVINKKEGDLKSLVNSIVKNFEVVAAGKKIKLSVKPCGDLPPVLFDEYAINRVLTNLIVNAIKFTPDGGQVVVHLLYCQDGKKINGLIEKFGIDWFITLSSPLISSISDSVLVVVTDSGIGIAKDKLNKLFLTFSQVILTQSTVKAGISLGTGLGLAIAKVIIQAHGGIINVAAEEGKGSSFYLTLPLALKK